MVGEPVATWQPADGEHGEEPVATCNRQTANAVGSGGGLMVRQTARRGDPGGSWTSIGALECKRVFTCTQNAPVMGSDVILACRSFEVRSLLGLHPAFLDIASGHRTMLSGFRTINLSVGCDDATRSTRQ
jgi:hypothetical protein